MKYTQKEVKQAMSEWASEVWEDSENNTKDESEFSTMDDINTKEEYISDCVTTILGYLNKNK